VKEVPASFAVLLRFFMPREEFNLLKKHSSLKIGGYADELVVPRDEAELRTIYACARSRGLKYRVIGKGSNLLFLDQGYDGLVIKNTQACSDLVLLNGRFGFLWNRRRLYVGASITNQKLIKFCIEQNLDAPTYLQTVPGNVGGALYMNAGTGIKEGRYFSEFVHRVHVFDGTKIFHIEKAQCGFEYRKSLFMETEFLILGCEIECRSRSGHKTREEASERVSIAKQTQDDRFPNAGSVFNRGFHDIKSIRSMREGGARFSEKTCNWIINDNNATSSDVLTLIARATAKHREEGLSDPMLEWIIVQ
jgi:UDP-N-acetylmuramate dehydrogenase